MTLICHESDGIYPSVGAALAQGLLEPSDETARFVSDVTDCAFRP